MGAGNSWAEGYSFGSGLVEGLKSGGIGHCQAVLLVVCSAAWTLWTREQVSGQERLNLNLMELSIVQDVLHLISKYQD